MDDMLLLWICWFCRGFTDPHLLPFWNGMAHEMAQCYASWLTNSVLPCHDEYCSIEQLFTWAHEQCSMSNFHDEQSCSMQTEPAIVATSCCQPVPVVQPAIMIYVFWIINRISQLQFKHAQGSTFNQWNLEKMGAAGSELSWDVYDKARQKSNSWVACVQHLSLNLE